MSVVVNWVTCRLCCNLRTNIGREELLLVCIKILNSPFSILNYYKKSLIISLLFIIKNNVL